MIPHYNMKQEMPISDPKKLRGHYKNIFLCFFALKTINDVFSKIIHIFERLSSNTKNVT